MSTPTPETLTPPAAPPKASVVREENKRLKALLRRCSTQFNANLAIIGRAIKDECKRCRGEMPAANCFRCSRVVATFGLLDDIDKVLR